MIFIAELWHSLRKTPFIQQHTGLDSLYNVLSTTYISWCNSKSMSWSLNFSHKTISPVSLGLVASSLVPSADVHWLHENVWALPLKLVSLSSIDLPLSSRQPVSIQYHNILQMYDIVTKYNGSTKVLMPWWWLQEPHIHWMHYHTWLHVASSLGSQSTEGERLAG